MFDKEIIEAFAASWASMQGRTKEFEMGKAWRGRQADEPGGGSYSGFLSDAEELLRRAIKRLPGLRIEVK